MKAIKTLQVTGLSLLLSVRGFADSKDSGAVFSISGYIDAYYAHYSDSAGHGDFQKFPTTSPRSNQVGLNIAQLTAQYDAEKIRGIVTIHYGDIPRSTWPAGMNFIQEAHAGVRLTKKLWLDAGLFRTHFGTEGLLPKENIASSIAVTTFYEPYFESGIRLNYVRNDKLSLNLYLLNGYNIFEETNNKKSFGMLVSCAPADNVSFGYSNYIGDDAPDDADSISHLRIHQNLFVNYQVRRIKVQVGIDYCLQKNASIGPPGKTADMFSGVAGLKYQCNKRIAVYGRGEWFSDPDGYMSYLLTDAKGKQTGLKLWGLTAGIEYKPAENAYLRLEARRLQTDPDQQIFRWNGSDRNSRLEITMNLGVTIQ